MSNIAVQEWRAWSSAGVGILLWKRLGWGIYKIQDPLLADLSRGVLVKRVGVCWPKGPLVISSPMVGIVGISFGMLEHPLGCSWVVPRWSQFVVFPGDRCCLMVNGNSGLLSGWSLLILSVVKPRALHRPHV